jgi:D-glycero-D-manno-heptose 1,7-bisphosphate phosphatase
LKKNKALFLDRDGIINVDKNYAFKISDIDFLPDIFDLVAIAQSQHFIIVVITNQSGIGRGLYSIEDFQIVTDWIAGQFASKGLEISATYYCPHHPTEGKVPYRKVCECRKPKPGLILRASLDLDIEISSSIFVGDNDSDIEAAFEAGIPNRIKVNSSASVLATENYKNLRQFIGLTDVFK